MIFSLEGCVTEILLSIKYSRRKVGIGSKIVSKELMIYWRS
jgi:hypothetical protein